MNSTGQHHRAEYWSVMPGDGVECGLCPHHCRLKEGQAGRCRVRRNHGGEMIAEGYGALSSVNVDPVEKKPLYHFHPGASILSIGGWGCNLGCVFCQNWAISQDFRKGRVRHAPGEIVALAEREEHRLVAYTYNEPLVGYEFVRDCCRLIRAAGGRNVLVTNGYVEEVPAGDLLPWVDALNIDIKSMDEAFYRHQCKAELAPVLHFCGQAVRAGCHVEITNLVIPGLNDTDDHFVRLATWIRSELGPLTPLHLSAYHPDYRLESPATPADTLTRAHELCRQELAYVYMGNLRLGRGQDTACPGCGSILIERDGYATAMTGLSGGACRRCGRKADLVLPGGRDQ